MCLIRKCHNEYLGSFPERWVDKIDTNNTTDLKEAFEKINQFKEKAFFFFANSALVGEYISYENSTNEIEQFLNDIPFIDYIAKDNQQARLYEKFIDFNLSLFNDLRHYQKLIDVSDRKYEVSEVKKEFGIIELKSRTNKDNSLSGFSSIVVPVCIYDYRFPMDDDSLRDLLNLKSAIERKIEELEDSDINLKQIYSTLLDKCHFFIKKARKEDIYFRFNSKVRKISPENLSVGGLQLLIDKERKNKYYTSSVLKFLEADIQSDNPKFASFVQLMRHFKKSLTDRNDVKKMDDIISQFEDLYKIHHKNSTTTKKEEYNNFALDTVRNYLYNCRFSFISGFNDIPFSDIERKIEEIKLIQIDGVKNFHPFEKGIECLRRRIHLILQKDTSDCSDEEFLRIGNKLAKLEELIRNYDESIKWCEYRKFYPFLLPFEESIVDDNGMSIFVPSTFAKAIDYSEQSKYLKESEEDYRDIKSLYAIKKEQRSIINLNNGIETRIFELESNVKGYEKRTYELLAIFTAIITFLFGAVNIFVANTEYNLPQLITNTIGLGLLLILFSTLVLASTSKLVVGISWKEFIKTIRFWILLVFLFSIPIIVFITCKSMPFSSSEEKQHKEIPSNQTYITVPVVNSIPKDTIKVSTHNSTFIIKN